MTTRSVVHIALVSCLLMIASALIFHALENKNPPPAAQAQPKALVSPASPAISAAQLPPHILAELTRLCGNCRIAASNAEWQSTDVVIGDSNLPTRRFTSISHAANHWDIRYERGGFAASSIRVLLSNDPSPKILPGSTCEPATGAKCYW